MCMYMYMYVISTLYTHVSPSGSIVQFLFFLYYSQVYNLLRTQGHNVVAVFTVPDINGRADPLADVAEKDGVPVFKYRRWRNKGETIPEVYTRMYV